MRSDIYFMLPQWLWGVEIHFDQMMYDWLYSSYQCLLWRCLHWGIAHPLVMDFMRYQFMLDTYFTSQILSCTLGLPILRECILTLRLDLLFMIALSVDYRDDDIFGISILNSLSLIWLPTYLCWTSKHPTFDTIIPASILSHIFFRTHLFHHPTWLYPLLLIRRGWRSILSFFGRVFTCLWTLGSTSSMMVEPISLMMYLWWCFHVDSWHITSKHACILDLESWLAFVYLIILVSMIHDFVWTIFYWGNMFS